MRTIAAFIVVGVMALAVFAEKQPETIEELKARAEQAKPEDQVKLFMEVAKRQMEAAGKAYDASDSDSGKAAIADVAGYAERAADAAIATGKHLKHTEIDVRKLAEKVEALRRAISVDDRPPLEAAGQQLDKIDSKLLDRMFKKKK